jgi:mannose-6-phosphate isomerase-like protein (cupin superfamily)
VGRPEVITKHELQNPPAEQSASMQRGQAFAHDGIWAGFAVFPGGALTGWHYHGDYATHAYITSGAMTVEFGPGGSELVEVGEGDFIYIPAHLITESRSRHKEERALSSESAVSVPPCSTSRDRTRRHDRGGWPRSNCSGVGLTAV